MVYHTLSRYGYADFSSSKDSKKALEGMTEAEICGRTIRLDLAHNTPGGGGGRGGDRSMSSLPRCTCSIYSNITGGGRGGRGGRGTPRGGGRGGGRNRDAVPPTNRLMVFNLSYSTEPYAIEKKFKGCNDVYLPKDRESGEKRG